MKKKFIQSTFILLIGGFITKFLGMFIKILMSRKIGLEGISLYMLVLPTFSLFMTLGQAGVPLSLSRMVASKQFKTKNLFFSITFFVVFYNLLLVLLIVLLAPFISQYLLHNSNTYLPLLAVGIVIPFTTISSLCRSYFIGKERMFPSVLSNILENVLRLFFLLFGVKHLSRFSTSSVVFFIILFNIVSEISSTILLLIFLPKKITFSDVTFQKKYVKEVLHLSFPNISGNLIGNVTYFLEPILFTSILLSIGGDSTLFLQNYGVLTGYVFPLYFLPTFFTYAFSQSILSYQTREYEKRHFSNLRKLFYLQIFLYFSFSVCLGCIFLIFGKNLLQLLYHTTLGYSYLRILAPFCFFYYSQSIFSYLYLAMGKTKEIFYTSFFSSVVRILSLVLYLFFGFGIYAMLFSFLTNIIFIFFFQLYRLHSYLS